MRSNWLGFLPYLGFRFAAVTFVTAFFNGSNFSLFPAPKRLLVRMLSLLSLATYTPRRISSDVILLVGMFVFFAADLVVGYVRWYLPVFEYICVFCGELQPVLMVLRVL